MQKAIMFRAYNGVEIIDTRPEAEISYSNMKYAEELASKRKQKRNKEHKKLCGNIICIALDKIKEVKHERI